jgi:hypothetical protein
MNLNFHPHMTALEIAQICERHNLIVTIKSYLSLDGVTRPWITAMEDDADDSVPMFLRAQAE